jgi:hypothetical protein
MNKSEAIPNQTDSCHFLMAEAVYGFPQVSEKTAAQPGAENRGLLRIH